MTTTTPSITTTTATLTTATALRSPWRWSAALMLTVSGVVHLALVPEHLVEAPYIGYLFLAQTLACATLLIALLVRDTPAVWVCSAVVAALAVLAYVASRSVGLPQIGDEVGQWFGFMGVVAVLSEAVTTALAVRVLSGLARRR